MQMVFVLNDKDFRVRLHCLYISKTNMMLQQSNAIICERYLHFMPCSKNVSFKQLGNHTAHPLNGCECEYNRDENGHNSDTET